MFEPTLIFNHLAEKIDKFILNNDGIVDLNKLEDLHNDLIILLPAFLIFLK